MNSALMLAAIVLSVFIASTWSMSSSAAATEQSNSSPSQWVSEQPTFLHGNFAPGGLVRGQLRGISQLMLNDKPIRFNEQGQFVFGFGRDAVGKQRLTWAAGGAKYSYEFDVVAREYQTQSIEGVASKYVQPPQTVLDRIRRDNEQIKQARSNYFAENFVTDGFMQPATGAITGVYGSQRIFNGVPKRPHYGLDIAGPIGAPVYAPAAGIVTLWHDDMYYSGGTLIIDHGLGVTSTFIHLDSSEVSEGMRVEKGQLVARIGNTGRTTGPHLDWRINWFSERLDPAMLLAPSQPTPAEP